MLLNSKGLVSALSLEEAEGIKARSGRVKSLCFCGLQTNLVHYNLVHCFFDLEV